ncbi:MAG: hypoxanthine phosphoribosyltransferase [Lactobacillaceae bacterium]|jgi:hypoxanthine phosphoribosyltransferase|nr:hypoxanthine phosphoribosyltransferase [Lactobacillaceae bacterium]
MTTENTSLDPRFSKVLFTHEQIDEAAQRIGKQIDAEYQNSDQVPVMVIVLKGAVMWAGDVMRHIKSDVEQDFINVSSYHGGTASTGEIKLVTPLTVDIKNRDVLIIEDIVDTGLSLAFLKRLFVSEMGAKSARVITMLDKKAVRKADVEVEFAGFEIEDEFVVGYGLDYKEIWRNIPFVGVINPEVI